MKEGRKERGKVGKGQMSIREREEEGKMEIGEKGKTHRRKWERGKEKKRGREREGERKRERGKRILE